MNNKNAILNHFFFLLLCVGFSSLQAQGWQKNYPIENWKPHFHYLIGYGDNDLSTTADGGAILGYQEFTEPDSLSSKITFKLIKVDQDGSLQWQNKFQDSTYNELSADNIKQTSDGGYIVIGDGESLVGDFLAKKFDQNGQLEWDKTYSSFNTKSPKHLVFTTPDNGFLMTSLYEDTITAKTQCYAIKTDSNGLIEWDVTFGNRVRQNITVLINSDNSYSFVSHEFDNLVPSNTGALITKVDSSGSVLWNKSVLPDSTNVEWHVGQAVKAHDGGFLMAVSDLTSQGANGPILIKTDSLGNKDWIVDFKIPNIHGAPTGLVKVQNGGYVLLANYSGAQGSHVYKIDDFGNIVWHKTFTGSFKDLEKSHDGGYYFFGFNNSDVSIIKLDKDGNLYANFLVGNVYHDLNLNCIKDANEPALNNMLLEAKSSNSFYGYTDTAGFYSIEVDTGIYDLSVLVNNSLWSSCTTADSIQVNKGDTIFNNFLMQALVDCPDLHVDISTPSLRRCFQNVYSVSYCNQGTIAAYNTQVEVNFHPYLDVISSTIPWSAQTNNTYTFPIGTLNVNDCGHFYITVIPNCDSTILNETLCVFARITPDSMCLPPSPAWDGSITTLSVDCGLDSLTFTITNTGQGNMIAPQDFFVIEDNLVIRQGSFQLSALQATELKFPANGSTYRLYAGQSPGHFPAGYHPTIAYEGCGLNSNGGFSTGFITMFPENDIQSTESIDCKTLIGAFDPNDKQAEPKGYDDQHYIEVGDDLEYHIRFQNTGTDTAFTVVVRDTISEHLDIATLLPGTASHAYELDIINGNVLKFTFNNILLVDSFANEPASHGFIKFKISQDTLLPLGTMIYNSAAIYFDFNEPIITNKTYHEIGKDFIPIVVSNEPAPEHPQLSVKVQPNPFFDYADFILEQAPKGKKTFQLYDALGKLVKNQGFTTDFSHRFYKHELNTGIYFYKILNDGKLLASGKIMAGN